MERKHDVRVGRVSSARLQPEGCEASADLACQKPSASGGKTHLVGSGESFD